MEHERGRIAAINISRERGTQKRSVPEARLRADWGIEGDSHAGHWHRQVSLLGYDAFHAFEEKGAPIHFGSFGENLLVTGFDFKSLPVGTRLRSGEVLLEITQIGKQCHSGCEIFHLMGDCIMPREGVFARVLHGGVLKEGDWLERVDETPDGEPA